MGGSNFEVKIHPANCQRCCEKKLYTISYIQKATKSGSAPFIFLFQLISPLPTSQWRVCYQRGLPRLVFLIFPYFLVCLCPKRENNTIMMSIIRLFFQVRKSMGPICPTVFLDFMTFSPGLETNVALQCGSDTSDTW